MDVARGRGQCLAEHKQRDTQERHNQQSAAKRMAATGAGVGGRRVACGEPREYLAQHHVIRNKLSSLASYYYLAEYRAASHARDDSPAFYLMCCIEPI